MTDLVNDSPVVDHTPSEVVQEVIEAKAEAAPAETPESAAPPVVDTASPTDEKSPESKPVEKTFTQSELDDILQKRLAKEHRKLERQARLEVENEYLRKQQAQPQQQVAQSVQDAGSGEPRPENFQTYEEYIEAVTDWKVEAKLDAKLRSLQEQSQERKQQSAQAQHEASIAENLSKAAEKYEDFHEVISNPNLQVTIAMRDAIGDSEIGGEIAYYLGTHADESAAIAKMSPVQQIKAIDRLEAKLKEPAPAPEIKPVSQAPKPIEPVRGVKTGSVKLETADMDTYLKERRAQGARWA
jgi:hypothetical protein